MNILGIESSCDETAAAILTDKLEIKASVVASQIDLHKVTHGVVPEVAARAHTEKIMPVIDECLRKSKLKPSQIDGVAVTFGPGLITSLLVGLESAKALAFGWDVPLIGVNHIEGHVLSNLLEQPVTGKTKKLSFTKKDLPLIVLTVSGGHTELLLFNKIGSYKLLGRTRDDAAGEAFDKVARLLGLPYPGGPAIGEQAEKGDASYIEFPRPMLAAKNYDFSFSGLKTAVVQQVAEMGTAAVKKNKANLAASFQEAVVDTLIGKAERAINEYNAKQLWIVGGVAANRRLRQKGRTLAKKKNINLRIPSFKFCTDNAVMIAAVGLQKLKEGKKSDLIKLQADPNLDLVS